MRVYVYWNIHKGCWSVKALSGPNKGRVVRHANAVHLRNVETHVNENGRQRVVANQRKEVHAGLKGELKTMVGSPLDRATRQREDDGWVPVTYNPYRFSTFVDRDTHNVVSLGEQAVMLNNGRPEVWVYNAA